MEQSRHGCRVVAVSGSSAEAGATTTAIHLGHAFAWSGEATLLIDFDPAADATDRLGVARGDTRLLERILVGEEDPSRVGLLVRSIDAGFDILPADAAELDAPVTERLRQILTVLAPQYGWIILDCPPGSGSLTTMARDVADEVITPTPESTWSTRVPTDGRVLTFASRRRPRDVGLGAVPADDALTRAAERQATLFQVAAESPAARAYVQIARSLIHGIQKAR